MGSSTSASAASGVGHAPPDDGTSCLDPDRPDAWRHKGNDHLRERAAAIAASNASYCSGDRNAAREHSLAAKRHGAAADAAHARAAALLLQRNNGGKPQGHLDLHGLRVAEAVTVVEQKLAAARTVGQGHARLVLVVGRGLHSRDGVARLRPAVEGLLERHGVRYTAGVPNAGCITVELVRPAPAVVLPPQQWRQPAVSWRPEAEPKAEPEAEPEGGGWAAWLLAVEFRLAASVRVVSFSTFDDPADPDTWRRKGDAHRRDRVAAAAASQAAYSRGDHSAAREQSARAKQHAAAAGAAHAKAVTLLLQRNNGGRGGGELDLHGLRVEEAMAEAERALAEAKAAGQKRLVLIVGKGLHSKDGVARLRPAIEGLMRKHSVRCTPGVPNEGCITVEFVRPEESGWVGWVVRNVCVIC
ncbi:Smr domain-containing protein [Tetrabaena socialis]|uniref:Smr domain-containing protein n=1 Tax=Tetrabaena socialis TaxID=47790 RepID=A0A2J8AK94_9CHLO|nr:Smr domain-containing protein [Tetrabaena socialis]|eukprot:PNH12946.1 Smr domain-containing protein [Tetrabaena socialis]